MKDKTLNRPLLIGIAGGTGSDTGPNIYGVIIDEQGTPSGRTLVTLIPSGYDPVEGGIPEVENIIDTTNENGEYELFMIDSGTSENNDLHFTTRQVG